MFEEENELIPVAMQIILHAGSGRTKAQEAIKHAKANDFEAAKQCLKEAKDNIVLAHKSQTTVIQNEAAGKSYEPCLLFTHAQDHLMTISSEVNLTRDLVDLFEIVMNK
ncbi:MULTISPECIES: PTS lactose/cellobiose transporter subunit IIA [unclassified Enterococcus]|uniref:PTS lactose/cellobiose transporter subunit IIA n=1 Tax=unclassified Enterococcus TaxID=2608891 RepID=UPI00247474F3|nr:MULTISPECIES: PTS lactose/cellobiose transporter subunit IIA [unclassified Enterococcus]